MALVEVIGEREEGAAWIFALQVLDDEGTLRRHDVTLAWADYNHWSRSGADEPGAVAAAVVRFMLDRLGGPDDLPPAFDASVARRRFEGADEAIPRLIAGP